MRYEDKFPGGGKAVIQCNYSGRLILLYLSRLYNAEYRNGLRSVKVCFL